MLKKRAVGRAKEIVSNKIGAAVPAVSLRPPVKIFVKRIYEDSSPKDGCRILVDRLWPRGVKKDQANIDLWLKEIAPSDSLRKWFNHEPGKWGEFERRYFKELEQKQDLVEQVSLHLKKGNVTFLFSAKNETQNNAIALKVYFLSRS